MDYTERDVIAEMTTALENHIESDGNEFDFDGKTLTVTATDGTTARFRVTVIPLD